MHPLRNPDVKTTLLPDGYVVLFSTKTEWAHTLSPVGALVWEFCDGEHAVEEITSELSGLISDVEKEVLSDQVQSFVNELLKSGLLLTAPVQT